MQLTVWQDAVAYYQRTSCVFQATQYALNRIVSQQLASVDSIHRNIAEGYCRRSIREYMHFLRIAIASAGESVSVLHAYRQANQISIDAFEELDVLAYKIENGLKRLIESLQRKRDDGSWQEDFVLRESNVAYGEVATD
jgi:four helix bundle protein